MSVFFYFFFLESLGGGSLGFGGRLQGHKEDREGFHMGLGGMM